MEENQPSEVEPAENITQAEDIEALKQALAEERAKAESYLDSWKRAQADFINYKRRGEQEREEFCRFANSALMLSLLPVFDDLERAFASVPPRLDKHSWVDGIRLIERKLRANLEVQGLAPIEALGEPFDPKLHEAVMHGKGKEGVVVTEIQKGYKLCDRVIRPSKVVVGNGEEDKQED